MKESARRFPPPWTVEETAPCFIVRDHNGQALAFVYFEEKPSRRAAADLLTRDEARRIAANIAQLPEPLGTAQRSGIRLTIWLRMRYRSKNMRPLIIGAILLLALAHLGPALGEDANHIIADCRAVTDEQSFKDMAEARECLGIIVGTRVGATLQSHILKSPPPFCIPDNVTRSQMVRVVADFIDRQAPILSTGAADKDANMLSYFAYFAMRET
jgi:hypothetical protein